MRTRLTKPFRPSSPTSGGAGLVQDSHRDQATVVLSGANLGKAHLAGATLDATNLRGADLGGAHLKLATLTNANLSHATLDGTDLRGSTLTKVNLEGASHNHANLTSANLFNDFLDRADLNDAHLSRATLLNGEFNGTDLTGADLSGASLEGPNLAKAVLYDAIWPRGAPPPPSGWVVDSRSRRVRFHLMPIAYRASGGHYAHGGNCAYFRGDLAKGPKGLSYKVMRRTIRPAA